ncbi:hypothetical protein G352_13647 [Rhodococcus ruber BKS 20-38]|uniref:Uncharacterized protein n=1 Tax=Rhodococcus ruber BKS 20-38 TaxID=1278076 RepID=M2Z9U2_9NOCA|nr:hypothetical protein [Rhodococcus ruber]EME64067.1 hypothetical protein G352_13647 [Rhodococcus ruber BKS 20-38]
MPRTPPAPSCPSSRHPLALLFVPAVVTWAELSAGAVAAAAGQSFPMRMLAVAPAMATAAAAAVLLRP